jgi:hypothetical protein
MVKLVLAGMVAAMVLPGGVALAADQGSQQQGSQQQQGCNSTQQGGSGPDATSVEKFLSGASTGLIGTKPQSTDGWADWGVAT